MSGEDDADLLRAWRGQAQEAPDDLLDRRVLKAAQAQRARRTALPLAAAMAACLVLAFYAGRAQQTAPPAPVAELDTSTFGLYEGRRAGPLADPEMMDQRMIRQMPDAATAKAISP
jgi:broad specificity phosphatase PhoE